MSETKEEAEMTPDERLTWLRERVSNVQLGVVVIPFRAFCSLSIFFLY
jgi:hypothetical protein